MDKLSPEQRHKNMAAIRGKDTKPDIWMKDHQVVVNPCTVEYEFVL